MSIISRTKVEEESKKNRNRNASSETMNFYKIYVEGAIKFAMKRGDGGVIFRVPQYEARRIPKEIVEEHITELRSLLKDYDFSYKEDACPASGYGTQPAWKIRIMWGGMLGHEVSVPVHVEKPKVEKKEDDDW